MSLLSLLMNLMHISEWKC